MPNFVRIATVLYINTQISEKIFQYVKKLEFLKILPLIFKFNGEFSVSPSCMSIGK